MAWTRVPFGSGGILASGGIANSPILGLQKFSDNTTHRISYTSSESFTNNGNNTYTAKFGVNLKIKYAIKYDYTGTQTFKININGIYTTIATINSNTFITGTITTISLAKDDVFFFEWNGTGSGNISMFFSVEENI